MAPKSFKLDCYSCKQLLKDSSLTLIWFCCVLFLIVFMKVPSEHGNNVIYCIRWLSKAFLVQCFQNFPPGEGGACPRTPQHSFAELPLAFGPLALKLHWQIFSKLICLLADFFCFLNATLRIVMVVLKHFSLIRSLFD